MDLLHYAAAAAQGWATVQAIAVAQPAAGADFAVTVPGGRTWEVLAVRAQLVTSAAVGTRQVALNIDGGSPGLTVSSVFSHATQAASLTQVYEWSRFATETMSAFQGPWILSHLLSGVLPTGWRLRAVTTALDAADQWSSVVLYVAEADVQLYEQRAASALSDVIGSPNGEPYQPRPYSGLFS